MSLTGLAGHTLLYVRILESSRGRVVEVYDAYYKAVFYPHPPPLPQTVRPSILHALFVSHARTLP